MGVAAEPAHGSERPPLVAERVQDAAFGAPPSGRAGEIPQRFDAARQTQVHVGPRGGRRVLLVDDD